MSKFINQKGMNATRHHEAVKNSQLNRIKKVYPDARLEGPFNCGCSPDCGGFYLIRIGESSPYKTAYIDNKGEIVEVTANL